jgi:hypothetical protein
VSALLISGAPIGLFVEISYHKDLINAICPTIAVKYSHNSYSHSLFIPSIKYIDTGHVKSKYIPIDATAYKNTITNNFLLSHNKMDMSHNIQICTKT